MDVSADDVPREDKNNREVDNENKENKKATYTTGPSERRYSTFESNSSID